MMIFQKTILTSIACCTILFCTTNVDAGKSKSVLELQVGKEVYTGRLEAKSGDLAWLMGSDGKLERVQLNKVTKFRKILSRFRPLSARQLRDVLARELGSKYEIASRGSYLVAARKGRAEKYAAVFDDLHRSFQRYFSTRGFKMTRPEFPMVAIVFGTHAEFVEYTKKDNFKAVQGLAGYYFPQSNRVALFESKRSAFTSIDHLQQDSSLGNNFSGFAKVGRRTSSQEALRNTMIHEATHQVAYNVGLHSRMGETPRWVVEGLATMLEPAGARQNRKSGSAMKRVNHQRYLRFQNFAATRRQPKSLRKFIGTDAMFQTNVLDFYAESWALSFYLTETRSRQYAKYLKIIAARPKLSTYSQSARIADFEKAFGKKIDWLEVGFLRFMKRLK